MILSIDLIISLTNDNEVNFLNYNIVVQYQNTLCTKFYSTAVFDLSIVKIKIVYRENIE